MAGDDDTVTLAERRDGSRSLPAPTVTPDACPAGARRHRLRIAPGARQLRQRRARRRRHRRGRRHGSVNEPPNPSAAHHAPVAQTGQERGTLAVGRHTPRSRRRRARSGETGRARPGGPPPRARPPTRPGRLRHHRAARPDGCPASPTPPSRSKTKGAARRRPRAAPGSRPAAPCAPSTPRTDAASSWCSSMMAIGIPAPCGSTASSVTPRGRRSTRSPAAWQRSRLQSAWRPGATMTP